MAQKIPPFGLRMPADVKRWVEQRAEQLERSQNYVIVQILKNTLENEKSGTTA